MTEPPGDAMSAEKPRSKVPVILRLLLATLLLVPGIAGFAVFLLLLATWFIQGFRYDPSELTMVAPVLFIGQFCFMFSAFFIAIILRYARWAKAPTASLVLAIVTGIEIAFASVLMVDALGAPANDDVSGLIILSVILMMIVSLPPFLHWRRAQKAAVEPAL